MKNDFGEHPGPISPNNNHIHGIFLIIANILSVAFILYVFYIWTIAEIPLEKSDEIQYTADERDTKDVMQDYVPTKGDVFSTLYIYNGTTYDRATVEVIDDKAYLECHCINACVEKEK